MESWKEVVPNDSLNESSAVTVEQLRSGFRPRVKNWLNAHEFRTVGERFVRPSLTVPDMSLSISELLSRQAAGLPLMGQRVPMYDPSDDLPDLRTLDLAEIAELRVRYAQEYQEIVENVNAEIGAKKAQKEADLRSQMETVWKEQWEAAQAASKSTNIT